MKFNPEKLKIPDQRMKPFIDAEEIWGYLNQSAANKSHIREIIAKSLDKNRLTLEETAVLINAHDPELVEEIKQGAKKSERKGIRPADRFVCPPLCWKSLHQQLRLLRVQKLQPRRRAEDLVRRGVPVRAGRARRTGTQAADSRLGRAS